MANLLTGDWRIRSGTHDAVDMTSTYNVKSLPRQADQRIAWWRPNDPAGALSDAAEDVEAFDGSWGMHGGQEVTWMLRQLSPLQVKYLKDTFFGGTRYTEAITIMTWDRGSGDWVVLNCKAHMRNPATDAEAPAGWPGYDNVQIDFYDAAVADEGNALITENGFQIALETGDILLLE